MDQNDLARINSLIGEHLIITMGLNAFDSGARIIGFQLGTPPALHPSLSITSSNMNYPPQIIETIKDTMTNRQTEIVAELANLGMTPEPGPPRPPSVPRIISRRQFFQASASRGMITQEEALDAVRHGEIPTVMQQGLDTLSPDQKFAAEMLLSGAGEFERRHPLVEKFAEVMHMPPEALDDIWRYAATL